MCLSKRYTYKILTFLGSLLLIHACANIATPTGGLYDVDPPKVVKAIPDFNSLNNSKTKIEIIFDENIKIEKPMDKVIIAPPQRKFTIPSKALPGETKCLTVIPLKKPTRAPTPVL